MDKQAKTHEQYVIEKYAKIEHQNTIITAATIILLPVLLLLVLLFDSIGITILSNIVKALGVILLLIISVFYVFIRRCPSCGMVLGKYTICPTRCPYCKISFK